MGPQDDAMMPGVSDVAWTAGIIDGEGSVVPTFQNTSPVRIKVSNTSMSMLVRLQSIWGGRIASHPHPSHRVKCKAVWDWEIYAAQKRAFLDAILPYLTTKRVQVFLALMILDCLHAKRREPRSAKHTAKCVLKFANRRGRLGVA